MTDPIIAKPGETVAPSVASTSLQSQIQAQQKTVQIPENIAPKLTPQQQLAEYAQSQGWKPNPMGGFRENLPTGGYKLYSVEPSGKVGVIQFTPSGNVYRAPTQFTIPSQSYDPYQSAGGRHEPVFTKPSGEGGGYYSPEAQKAGNLPPSVPATATPPQLKIDTSKTLTPSEAVKLGEAKPGTVLNVEQAIKSGQVGGYSVQVPSGKTEYFLTEKAALVS